MSAAFQRGVADFMILCFGRKAASDTVERNHRFLEEALELVQALGCTASEAHQLVDYVFGRPIGNSHQETGGVLVTLAALCTAASVDMQRAGVDELERVWTKIDAIREKQKRKPRFSPLPGAVPAADPCAVLCRECATDGICIKRNPYHQVAQS